MEKLMVKKQIQEFLIEQRDMSLVDEIKTTYTLQGNYHFAAIWNEISYRKDYKLKVVISGDFPLTMPKIYCCDNSFDNYSHLNLDKSFCLGVIIDNYLKLQHSPTILNFFKLLVDPYLYSFEFVKEFGIMPFGERPHGINGVLEFYKEYFEEQDTEKCKQILKYVVENRQYRGHHSCPCGSGLSLRKCHGNILKTVFEQKGDKAYAILLTKDMEEIKKYVQSEYKRKS